MSDHSNESTLVRFVQFDAPGKVSVQSEKLAECKIDEVEVLTKFSAVSSGTELLLYNGDMPADIPADEVFESKQESFGYPCRYGYAAVGTVVRSHDDAVPKGSVVFAFREHTSRFCEKSSKVERVPHGIDALDACFFPNVETAVSLAFDAKVLPGESVTIVGQGVVGLLLTAVFHRIHPYSQVVTVDTKRARRQVSVERAGADYSFDAHEASGAGGAMSALFPRGTDVSVDVTGCGAGLQTAICCTRDHGRVVIGSWFGRKCVVLPKLGGRFHRSHIELVASQVSCIPPGVSGRWTKGRRFDLVWKLLRDIRPAQWLPLRTVGVEEAPSAYAELAGGTQLQVVLWYGNEQG
ncbi:zinc-binding dehydrogenase [Gracilaria domingensis]|nr:zinc-binding dehydrogenase [Gracilaria domingensis]